MSLEKLGLTLYDFLGYLFPGFVLVMTGSLIEATFLNTDLLALSSLGSLIYVHVVTAYFLGHISHRIGSLLKDKFWKLFSDRSGRISPELLASVDKGIEEAYGLTLSADKFKRPLERYQLADSYLVVSGGSNERDVLMALEGFQKGSMVAFLFLSLTLVSTLFAGGVSVQSSPGVYASLGAPVTAVFGFGFLVVSLLFRNSFLFYNRVKNNSILLEFLAVWKKESRQKA